MGKIEYKTDAFNHSGEHVVITTSGEDILQVDRTGYGIEAVIFGLSGTEVKVDSTSSAHGFDTSTTVKMNMRYTLPQNSTIFSDSIITAFNSKYGSEKTSLFLSEVDALRTALAQKENNYLAYEICPGSGVPTWNGSHVASNATTPSKSGFGTPETNYFNENAAGKPYSSNESNEYLYNNSNIYYLFTIIRLAAEHNIYTF